MQKIEEEDKL